MKFVACILALLLSSSLSSASTHHHHHRHHDSSCSYSLVESIPQHMDLSPISPQSIAQAFVSLASTAKATIDIASFYWSLTGGDSALGGQLGQDVFDALSAAAARGVALRIVQSVPSSSFPDDDSAALASLHPSNVALRSINMTDVLGSGIVHTKFWVVDGSSIFVGSANMDWRSLSQVKELGAVVSTCPSVARDLLATFESYWIVAAAQKVPVTWPSNTRTQINQHAPATDSFNGQPTQWFLTASPARLCPDGRSVDIDALVAVITSASKSVSIEVMDYMPIVKFGAAEYWPIIDDAIRQAAWARGVDVKLLIGNWTNSWPPMFSFLRSLDQVNDAIALARQPGSISVRLFNVPADPSGSAPYTRVNHAKFMVSEQDAFISTSNWSGDYFISTAGVSLVMRGPEVVQQLQQAFDRDWDSKFAVALP